jgi:hypothetical protein
MLGRDAPQLFLYPETSILPWLPIRACNTVIRRLNLPFLGI